MRLSLDPGAMLYLAVAAGLYARAVAILRRRGYEVPHLQQALWYAGLALMAIALLGPLDPLADDLLSAHMGQHLLIADLAAPLLVAGLRTPVLVFLLPRPLLVRLARQRRLRTAFRTLRRPLVAIPVYIGILYSWHFAFMFVGALRHPALHVLQHGSFVAGSVLVWWSAIEPRRRRLPGELWKAAHIMGARLAGMMLGMAFVIMRTPAYSAYYGDAARGHGMTPLFDQQLAGGMMLGLDLLVMLSALAFFFYRAAQDHDRAERALTAAG